MVLLCLAVTACAEPTRERYLPVTDVVGGVATLERLPDLLDPEHFWHPEVVREVRTVIPGVEEPLLFDPDRLVVLHDGALFVHDPPADRPLVVLDAEAGAVATRFGRKGRGPDELGRTVSLIELEDGTLAVFDYANRRVHRYGRDGEELGGVSVRAPLVNGVSAASPDGRGFVVETLRSEQAIWSHDLRVIDPSTGIDELLLRLPDLPAGKEYTWRAGRALWASLGGGLVGMWGGETRFSVYGADGRKVREVTLPLSTRVLGESEIQEQIRLYGSVASRLAPGPMGFTNFLWPVNDSVFGTLTGNLWRAAEDPELPPTSQVWRLFTLDGEYLGVMNHVDVLGRGSEGTFWVKALDEDLYPVLQEVRLARGGELEVPEEVGR